MNDEAPAVPPSRIPLTSGDEQMTVEPISRDERTQNQVAGILLIREAEKQAAARGAAGVGE